MPSRHTKLREKTDKFLGRNLIKGRVVFECENLDSLTRSVKEETGMAFLPIVHIQREIQNKTLYSIGPKDGLWRHSLWLGCHNDCKDDYLIHSIAQSFEDLSKTDTL